MSRPYVLGIALGFVAVACEGKSDEERLKDLQLKEAVAILRVTKWKQDVEARPSDRALRDSLLHAERLLILARRDLNKFMSGK